MLWIKFEDNFRYKIIGEDFWPDTKTRWSKIIDVTNYCINSYNVNPSIIIIDKPGFFDTSGKSQDIAITRQTGDFFFDKFLEASEINFICQSSNERYRIYLNKINFI